MPSGTVIAPDRRASIIEDALPRLAVGQSTDTIAADHGIAGIDEVLAAYEEQKAARVSGDHDAARSAAAEFKSAAWLAERRLSTLFGAKSEVNHGVQVSVTINNPSERTLTIEQVSTD